MKINLIGNPRIRSSGHASGRTAVRPQAFRKKRSLYSVCLSVRIGNTSYVEYSRRDFKNLLSSMHAQSCHSIADYTRNKEKRASHPLIKGLEVFDGTIFSFGDKKEAGEAAWLIKNSLPPTVILEKGSAALVDVENASAELMVGFKAKEHNSDQVIKGKHKGRETILIIDSNEFSSSFESISKWMRKNEFIPEQIIMVTGRKEKEITEETKTYFHDYPDIVLNVYAFSRDCFVMVGPRGYSLVDGPGIKTYGWKENAPQPTTNLSVASLMRASTALNTIIKDSVEGLIFEYVTQNGLRHLTMVELKLIYENISKNEIFHYLKNRFIEDFQEKGGNLKEWTDAFALFAAPEVMRVFAPVLQNNDPKVTLYRSFYYAFSRISRITGQFDYHGVKAFLGEIFDELKEKKFIDQSEYNFLSEALNCRSTPSNYQGIEDHDAHACVARSFSRYSPFPFWFLQKQFDLLSLTGGYGRDGCRPVLKLMAKKGYHELVIAEHLKGKIGHYGKSNVETYAEIEGLIDKYGFEIFGKIMGSDKETGEESVQYLLPAIEHLVKTRDDLEVEKSGSLFNGFFKMYAALIDKCPHAKYALPTLKHLIQNKEDLDPAREGSLASLLVQIYGESDKSSSENLFLFGIRNLAHLFHDLAEIDPQEENSLAGFIIGEAAFLSRRGWGSEQITWMSLTNILPFVRSKSELIELVKSLSSWDDNLANFKSLIKLVDKEIAEEVGMGLEQIGHLVIEIIMSQKPTYTVFLEGALATKSIKKNRYQILRDFIANFEIDLKLRMKVLSDYSELLQLDAVFFPEESWPGRLGFGLEIKDSQKEEGLGPVMEKLTIEINSIIEKICQLDPGKKAQRRKQQEFISKKLNTLRYSLISHIMGRPLNQEEKQLLSNSHSYEKILRLVGLVFTIEGGGNFRQGSLARAILKQALDVLFSSYAPDKPQAKDKAIESMNKWLYSLAKEEIIKIYSMAYPHENEEIIKRRTEIVRGNREIREQLVALGYKKKLWSEGVDILVPLSEGLTQEEKRQQILSATFELVEIALMTGLQEMGEQRLTLNYAEKLDSYKKAKEFIGKIQEASFDITDELKNRLRYVLESVRDMESQRILHDAEETTFRATIKKDLFTEAYAGVGVPGCFNPRGIQREMPFVHGTEANSAFMQVFSPKGNQVANAVIVFADEGAYVYAGYNSSGYNMDKVFGEALRELSKMVPAILLSSASAGFNSLKNYSKRAQKKIVKPPAIITGLYFDSGKVDKHGNLTIEESFYVATEGSIREEGGFKKKSIPLENREDFPEIDWQPLADKFLLPDFTTYPFLQQVRDPRVFLSIIGRVKSRIMTEGQLAVNSGFYAGMREIIEGKLPGVEERVKDEVTDLIIDFLEKQAWPMEILTPISR